MVDEVWRRTTAAHRQRRGGKTDPEWINRRRLPRAAERLIDDQRTRLFERLTRADPNSDIAAVHGFGPGAPETPIMELSPTQVSQSGYPAASTHCRIPAIPRCCIIGGVG